MISVYKVFQLVFGAIASIFILMFLIQYTGIYSGIQEQSQSITILKNFNKVAGDVYLTGNPIDFRDFSNFNLDECFTFFNEPDSPVIKCGSLDYPTYIPMIFHSGDYVMIDTSQIDMGWWKTNYLLVYPELTIIFNPLDESWDDTRMMRNITSMFNCEWGVEGYACTDIKRGEPFPTVLEVGPRAKFGYCDGDMLYDMLCDGDACERYDFFSQYFLNEAPGGTWEPCRAEMPSQNYKVVTIADNCNAVNLQQGVCIETSSDGSGRMRIAGSDKTYIYKDILDIMALVIGGDEQSTLNRSLGEINYIFKNEVMMKRLALAAKITNRKMQMLVDMNTKPECVSPFSEILDTLCSYSGSICALAEEDYFGESFMRDLRMRMDEAELAYDELMRYGCLNA